MSFHKAIKTAIDIIKLDKKAIQEVSKHKNAMLTGIIIVAIGILSYALSLYIKSLNPNLLMFNNLIGNVPVRSNPNLNVFTFFVQVLVSGIIGIFIMVGIYHIISKLFGGKGTYMDLFLPVSYAAIFSWLFILKVIPVIGNILILILSLWMLVVFIKIIQEIYKIPKGKAIGVVFTPVVLMLLLSIAVLSKLNAEQMSKVFKIWLWQILNF